jgi:CHAT domain-containing protein
VFRSLVSTIVLSLSVIASAQADELTDKLKNNYFTFASGNYLSAIESANELEKLASLQGYDTQLFILHYFADLCMRAYDPICANSFLDKSTKLLNLETNKTKEGESPFRVVANISKVIQNILLTQNKSNFEELIKFETFLLEKMTMLESPLAYVEAHMVLSQWHLSNDNKIKAIKHLDIAWANFLAIEKINDGNLIRYGLNFIFLFQQASEFKKAIYINQLIRPILFKNLNSHKYEALKYSMIGRNIAVFENNLINASQLSQLGIEILRDIQIPDYQREYFSTQFKANYLIDCFQLSDKQCTNAEEIYIEISNSLSSDKIKQEDQKLSAAVSATLYKLSRNLKPDEQIINILKNDIDIIKFNDSSSISKNSAKEFQKFLIDISERKIKSAQESIIKAAKSEITDINRKDTLDSVNVITINSHQRAILTLASTAITSQENINKENKIILFNIIELLNTNSRNIESNYLKILGNSKNRSEVSTLQTYFRLKQDSEILQRKIFNKRVQDILTGLPTNYEKPVDTDLLIRILKLNEDKYKINIPKENKSEINFNLLKIQEKLRKDEAYISYQVNEGNLIIMCTDKNQIHVGKSAIYDNLSIDLKIIKIALSNPLPPSAEIDNQYPINESFRLSSFLLEPIKNCLKEKQHLFFFQDESISGISHHALIDPTKDFKKTNFNSKKIPWLGLNYSISLISNSEQLVAARNGVKRIKSDINFLGVGNPTLSGETIDGKSRGKGILRGIRNTRDIQQLEPLPDTEIELLNVAKNFKGESTLLLGDQATETAFRRLVLRSFNVIEFATHGLIREEIDGLTEAALVLTPENFSKEIADGLITSSDISRMDLNASLVILSACNSAKFNEDIFSAEAGSLSTAFFMAGVKTTLASLWSVNSEATRMLIESFSKEFANQKSASLSLRNAMKDLIFNSFSIDYSNPRYWASFMIYGDNSITINSANELTNENIFSNTNLLSNQIGHIQQSFRIKDNTIIVGARPVTANENFIGFVRLINDSGNILWEHTSHRGFFNIIKEEKSEFVNILFSPYFKYDDDYEIIKFDFKGKLISTIKFKHIAGEQNHNRIVKIKNNVYLFPTVNLEITQDSYEINLNLIDINYGLLKSQKIKAESKFISPLITLSSKEEIITIALSGSNSDRVRKPILKDGYVQPCFGEMTSEIIQLNSDLKETKNRFKYINTQINQIEILDGKEIWAFTKTDECMSFENKRFGIAIFENSEIKIEKTYEIQGHQVSPSKILNSEGSYLIVGNLTRKFVDLNLSQIKQSNKFDEISLVNTDPDSQTGVFFMRVNKNLAEVDSDVLFNGSDLFIDDFTYVNPKEFHFFGASGNSQFSSKLRLQ